MLPKEFRTCEVLARTYAAVCGIRKPFICQVKPFESSTLYDTGASSGCSRNPAMAAGGSTPWSVISAVK
jgi:hypothetical protein